MKTGRHAQIKNREILVTEENQSLITDFVTRFVWWLEKKKIKKISKAIISFEFFEMGKTGETMIVGDNNDLHFNLSYLNKCSIDYYITIVLHEAYHYFINNIPNKKDANRVKDYYFYQVMNHIDIEADVYVAMFFKEEVGYSLEEYLALYYRGSSVFADDEIRPAKINRFVCSMLSIAHYYFHHEFAIYNFNFDTLRVLKMPRAIVHKGLFSETKLINMTLKGLNILQKLYQCPSSFNENTYVKNLVDVLSLALDRNEAKNEHPEISFVGNLNNRIFQIKS